jgi:hypothetical protein
MKNIHLIPTDKPSRLTIRLKTGELMFSYKEFVNQQSDGITLNQNQHIYITSDEEIKDGWSYDRMMKSIGKRDNVYSSKIILTTDQDLIKDGVQSIDNEFLEWFVKNPSCEEVEIVKIDTFKKTNEVYVDEITGGNYYEIIKHNKIIIPQEEQCTCKLGEPYNNACCKVHGSIPKEKHPKQIKCYCGHTTYCDCGPLEEPKQIYYNTVGVENGVNIIKGQFKTQKEALDLANELNRKFPDLYYICGMKNIHLLPTSKPSRLILDKDDNILHLQDEPVFMKHQDLVENQHIYITNDETIKEGDWVITYNGLLAKVITEFEWHFKNSKKIILTTDQDLIKDGVQAIDDTFLEWFVKNSSCEYVKLKDSKTVKEHIWDGTNDGEIIWEKEIIIPQEEHPKQIKCYCGHTTYCDCSPLEEHKQETLEEAAEKVAKSKAFEFKVDYKPFETDLDYREYAEYGFKKGFLEGTKWQQERMYNEKEVESLLHRFMQSQHPDWHGYSTTKWFEQFKKNRVN